MRKVADSALGAVTLDKVRAETAIDLGGKKWLAEAKQRRARAAFADQVATEITRLTSRISWLQRKAARLPIGNGRRKAKLEAQRLQAVAMMLPIALDGRQVQKLPEGFGSTHQQRAVRLLNDLAAC